jgi:hypothetical protein
MGLDCLHNLVNYQHIVWNVITLVTAANYGGIISIIISGIILYYLFRPHVKVYFGKGVNPSRPAT